MRNPPSLIAAVGVLLFVLLFGFIVFGPKPTPDGANYVVTHRHAGQQGNDTYRAVDVQLFQGRAVVDLPGGERIELMGDIEVRRISK